MTRGIVIVLLLASVGFFTWYFINNQESFSPCINCHLHSEHQEEKYKTEKNSERSEISEDEISEISDYERSEISGEKKTLLDFDDFREPDTRVNKLDSILKSPEEQKSFIPSQSFTGQRDGYVFKNGRHGNGYYLDRHVQFNL